MFEGKKFGYLKAIKLVSGSLWACRCDCGEWCFVHYRRLDSGERISCGCANGKKEKKTKKALTREQAAINQIYKSYRASAEKRQLEFRLTWEEFALKLNENCWYCGSLPMNVCKVPASSYGAKKDRKLGTVVVFYNGIDRKDNSIGYILDNVVACCGFCNNAKKDLSVDQFRDWVNRLTTKLGAW